LGHGGGRQEGRVPAIPEGRPAAADLPSQLLHVGGAARRAPARGHRAVPRLHGVSAGTAAGLLGCAREGKGLLHRADLAESGEGTDLMTSFAWLLSPSVSEAQPSQGRAWEEESAYESDPE
ncbi:hypothetical protein Nmel_008783, partial [Mimus melanotis]